MKNLDRPDPMTRIKTTGHIKTLALFVFSALLLTGPTTTTARADAPRILFTTSNDLIAGEAQGDDLYTAALALEVQGNDLRWRFGERMFTDRRRAFRFDETYLELARSLGPPSATAGGWFGEISGGVIHLGRGLLGEGVQNEVHRVVGAERVSLPYLESDRWVGSATLRGGRALPVAAPWSLEVEGEVHLAPAFRSWQKLAVVAERELAGGLAMRAGVGARLDQTDGELLGDRVARAAATAELGLAWRGVSLRWSLNDFGTRASYLSLGIDLAGDAFRSLRTHPH